jgi:hypothetical protein
MVELANMKKKMKRYEDGGEIEFETKMGSNKSISDDIREKAMRAVAEGGQKDVAPIAKKTVRTTTTKLAMPDYSNEDLDRMGLNNDLKPAKSRMQPETDREEYSPFMRQFRKDEAKEKANKNYMPENLRSPDYKAPSVVKNVSKEVTKPTPRSPSQMIKEESEYAIKPRLQSKGERLMKSMGLNFKSGGKVSSASKRADGCAIRGKTRA